MRSTPVARPPGRPATRWLAWIVLLAVVPRVAGAVYQGDTVAELPGVFDQVSYDGLAQRVAAGYGFTFAEGHWPATRAGEPTAHWSFLYTIYLAVSYALFGVHPLIPRLVQAVAVGVLQPWLAWRVGRRVFGEPVGLLAALGTAVYAYFIYYAGSLLTEAFYFVGILWTLDAALRAAAAGGRRSPARWTELGVAIGVTTLLRQVFLVFVPALFAWLWWTSRATRGRDERARPAVAGGLAVTTAVVLVLVLPWTVRNYRAFGSFVLLNTNAGFAFYWGNHPVHGSRFLPLLVEGGPTYGDLIPAELRSLDEAALDRALLGRAASIVSADPGRFLALSMSRVREYVRFWPSPESGALSNLARLASFGLFLPFIVCGLWLAARRPGGPDVDRAGVALLGLWLVVYTGVHLATWTLIRYRLPVDVVLVIFAAVAADALIARRRRTGAPAVRR